MRLNELAVSFITVFFAILYISLVLSNQKYNWRKRTAKNRSERFRDLMAWPWVRREPIAPSCGISSTAFGFRMYFIRLNESEERIRRRFQETWGWSASNQKTFKFETEEEREKQEMAPTAWWVS